VRFEQTRNQAMVRDKRAGKNFIEGYLDPIQLG